MSDSTWSLGSFLLNLVLLLFSGHQSVQLSAISSRPAHTLDCPVCAACLPCDCSSARTTWSSWLAALFVAFAAGLVGGSLAVVRLGRTHNQVLVDNKALHVHQAAAQPAGEQPSPRGSQATQQEQVEEQEENEPEGVTPSRLRELRHGGRSGAIARR